MSNIVYVVRIGNELAKIVRTGTLSCHNPIFPSKQISGIQIASHQKVSRVLTNNVKQDFADKSSVFGWIS